MTGNDFMSWILRSPFHGVLSNGMMLITVTGHKRERNTHCQSDIIETVNLFGSSPAGIGPGGGIFEAVQALGCY